MTKEERAGDIAAIIWMGSATIHDKIAVAAADFRRGMTLDWFRSFGVPVPDSDDPDYSWGFYRNVKAIVDRKLRSCAS
jgi:hypothetical protein